MTSYVVIESTPGYMPDSDDPLVTDVYADAVAYVNELCDELEDQGYTCDRSWASGSNYYAAYCTRTDSEHDLGRYISIENDES